MAITKTATRDLTTAIAGEIWNRIKDADNRRLEDEAGVDPAVKKARRDLDKEDPEATKVYDKDLRGLISKIFGRIDVQVSQTENKVDNLSNKISAVGGEVVNTQQMIINQNEMLEEKFDELLGVLSVKKDQNDDKKQQREFEQLELNLEQKMFGGSGSTTPFSKSKASGSYSGLVNWFKVKATEMMSRVVRRAWKSRFLTGPRRLYKKGRKKIYDTIKSAATSKTGSRLLSPLVQGKMGRRLLQTALGRGSARLVPILSAGLAADDLTRYSKKGDWLGASLAFIDMAASGTEGAYASGVGAPVGAAASIVANIAGGALTVYEIAQILMGGDPYATKGILPFERGTAKQPSFAGVVSGVSPIVSVVRAFGEQTGFAQQTEAMIGQAGLSDTPMVEVSHPFTVGGSISSSSIEATSSIGTIPDIFLPKKKEELKEEDDSEKSSDNGDNSEYTGGRNRIQRILDPFQIFTKDKESGGGIGTSPMLSQSTGVKIDASGESGVDFTPDGPNNRAVFPGVVTEIGHQYNPNVIGGDGRKGAGYGNYVVVTSTDPQNGEKFDGLYAHFPEDSIAVRVGQTVEYGDILGPMATAADYADPVTRKQVGSGTGAHTSLDFLKPGGTSPYPHWRTHLVPRVDPSFRPTSKLDVGKLNPPPPISSLNSNESPVSNLVSDGSMNRQLAIKQKSKRSSIVIINNQIIRTSNLTVPLSSGAPSDKFFEAYNLARLG